MKELLRVTAHFGRLLMKQEVIEVDNNDREELIQKTIESLERRLRFMAENDFDIIIRPEDIEFKVSEDVVKILPLAEENEDKTYVILSDRMETAMRWEKYVISANSEEEAKEIVRLYETEDKSYLYGDRVVDILDSDYYRATTGHYIELKGRNY